MEDGNEFNLFALHPESEESKQYFDLKRRAVLRSLQKAESKAIADISREKDSKQKSSEEKGSEEQDSEDKCSEEKDLEIDTASLSPES